MLNEGGPFTACILLPPAYLLLLYRRRGLKVSMTPASSSFTIPAFLAQPASSKIRFHETQTIISHAFLHRFPPQTQLLFLTFKLLSVAREKSWLCGPQRPLKLQISGCEFTMESLRTTGFPSGAQSTSHIPHVKVPPTLQALQRPADPSLWEATGHYSTRGKQQYRVHTLPVSPLGIPEENQAFFLLAPMDPNFFPPWFCALNSLNFIIIFYFYASIPARALWKGISTRWFCGFISLFFSFLWGLHYIG